jgi:hypothetical protein
MLQWYINNYHIDASHIFDINLINQQILVCKINNDYGLCDAFYCDPIE